jgi:bifunctional UDP-N-acetylglucosamine pyrophosphorylase/glucosamine-1-phosphate N-acetyltransferase
VIGKTHLPVTNYQSLITFQQVFGYHIGMSLSIVILAAGKGTRMRSERPKVLHTLAGKPLLEHVYHAASELNHNEIYVVYGYGGDQVKTSLAKLDVNWIEQTEQLGTGHAVKLVASEIPSNDLVLILHGDIPLMTTETLEKLVNAAKESGFSLLTSYLDNPAGYGRIIRDDSDNLLKIVEEKDATDIEREINEINTGMMVVSADSLKQWVNALNDQNSQNEFYLTDIIEMAVLAGTKINTINPGSSIEVHGINDRTQLAEMERYYQLIQTHQLMRHGVTIVDPARFDLRGDLELGQDIFIDINVLLEGRLKIGSNVSIGANCCIKDSIIDDDVEILPNCIIENAIIGKACRVGPFSRIRPDTVLGENVHVGNFVEIKNSEISNGTKINHLSYVGDSEIGKDVNVGAGTITCNYDGAHKHKTVIEDNVFIGSDTQLVAPVKIGAGATIGAGTTITEDVNPDTLAISRVDQKSIKNWKRPKKK